MIEDEDRLIYAVLAFDVVGKGTIDFAGKNTILEEDWTEDWIEKIVVWNNKRYHVFGGGFLFSEPGVYYETNDTITIRNNSNKQVMVLKRVSTNTMKVEYVDNEFCDMIPLNTLLIFEQN